MAKSIWVNGILRLVRSARKRLPNDSFLGCVCASDAMVVGNPANNNSSASLMLNPNTSFCASVAGMVFWLSVLWFFFAAIALGFGVFVCVN